MPSPEKRPVESTLDANLSYRISILHSLLGKLTTRIYAFRSLTSHQWKVLSILYNWPPMPAVRITNLVTLDKAAISRGVSGLLDLKLARRYLDSESGMIFITLTESGRAKYRSMAAEMADLQQKLFVNLRDAEKSSFFLVLDKIEHALRIANSVGMPGHVGARSRKGRNSKTSIARRKPAAKAKRIAS